MYYVMSDIHGCYDEFMTALSHWDKQTETLVVLGDLIDRGPNSIKVVETLDELQQANPDRVIVLKGNHDQSFVAWALHTPEEELKREYMGMHDATVMSCYNQSDDPAENIAKYKRATRKQKGLHIRYHYMKALRFLDSLPMYHETENIIFVHAGINLRFGGNLWRNDKHAMNTIRNPFIYASKKAPKRVFFGHTPTALIRDNNTEHAVWISEYGDKVGIDGACAFGGQLNALKVDNTGAIIEIITVPSKQTQPV